MKDYTAWMTATETWKIWFKAENLEQAKEIVSQLQSGDVDVDDVDGYGESNKGIETEYDVNSVEEHNFSEGEEK